MTGAASVFAGFPGNFAVLSLAGGGGFLAAALPYALSPGGDRRALTAPGALPLLDPVIHAQPRLRVMVALAALPDGDEITFPRLQELAGMTAGNLATHLRKLEDAGYITVTKSFRRRTPVTYLALTRPGAGRSRTTPPRCAACSRRPMAGPSRTPDPPRRTPRMTQPRPTASPAAPPLPAGTGSTPPAPPSASTSRPCSG